MVIPKEDGGESILGCEVGEVIPKTDDVGYNILTWEVGLVISEERDAERVRGIYGD